MVQQWVLRYTVVSKEGIEVLHPFIRYSFDGNGKISVYNSFLLDEATVTDDNTKESLGGEFITLVTEGGFENVRWEPVGITVDRDKSQGQAIWIVNVTDDVAVSSSGSETRFLPELNRDGANQPIPIIPAISTFIFKDEAKINIITCVNEYLAQQNSEQQMYEDDTVQVIKETEDLKIYKLAIEDEDDAEDEFEIYIQIERKILA